MLGDPHLKEEPNSKASLYQTLGIYGAVGFQLAITVVVGLLGGNYLDQKFGTAPWLAMAGLLLGSVDGFYNLIRILIWHQDRKK